MCQSSSPWGGDIAGPAMKLAGPLAARSPGLRLAPAIDFRSSTRRRHRLQFQFDPIVFNGGTDEILQSTLINRITLEQINRSPLAASEARVEELVRIRKVRSVGKGKLHLIFVGVADRDHSVARPHRASHPLPFLDDLPVGLQDALADAGERFATPVCESCDQLVNAFRWIHWIFMPPILAPFSCW